MKSMNGFMSKANDTYNSSEHTSIEYVPEHELPMKIKGLVSN
jgi:hypothetical protein